MFVRQLRLFILTAALLFGQLGGVAHGLGHLQDEDRPPAPCQLCVAYAALDHAVAAPPSPLPAEYASPLPAVAPVAASAAFSSRPYRARAPPYSLV